MPKAGIFLPSAFFLRFYAVNTMTARMVLQKNTPFGHRPIKPIRISPPPQNSETGMPALLFGRIPNRLEPGRNDALQREIKKRSRPAPLRTGSPHATDECRRSDMHIQAGRGKQRGDSRAAPSSARRLATIDSIVKKAALLVWLPSFYTDQRHEQTRYAQRHHEYGRRSASSGRHYAARHAAERIGHL